MPWSWMEDSMWWKGLWWRIRIWQRESASGEFWRGGRDGFPTVVQVQASSSMGSENEWKNLSCEEAVLTKSKRCSDAGRRGHPQPRTLTRKCIVSG